MRTARQWQKQQQWRACCAIRHICEKSPGGLYTILLLLLTYENYYRPSCRYNIRIHRYEKKGRPKSITCPGGARSPSRSNIVCVCVYIPNYNYMSIYNIYYIGIHIAYARKYIICVVVANIYIYVYNIYHISMYIVMCTAGFRVFDTTGDRSSGGGNGRTLIYIVYTRSQLSAILYYYYCFSAGGGATGEREKKQH